jgi:DNA repair protein RecO (recombination protein O)
VAVIQSDAIVLSAIRYGETSKIVRLATRDHGVISAIAKGASRPKSRFGGALQILSNGLAHWIPPRHGELNTLTAFDLARLPIRLGESLPRYAGALALAEVVQRFGSTEPDPMIFEGLSQGLLQVEEAPGEDVEAAGIRALWHVLGVLGFSPAVEACVLDGTLVTHGERLAFSASDGGALCDQCAHSRAAAWLERSDYEDLVALLDPDTPLPTLDERHATAHRRLLARFVQHQVADGADLPALEFWLREPWVIA